MALVAAALIAALTMTLSPIATPAASASTCLPNTVNTGGISLHLPVNCPPPVPGKPTTIKPTTTPPLDVNKLKLHITTPTPLTRTLSSAKRDQTTRDKGPGPSPDPCVVNPKASGCTPAIKTGTTIPNPCVINPKASGCATTKDKTFVPNPPCIAKSSCGTTKDTTAAPPNLCAVGAKVSGCGKGKESKSRVTTSSQSGCGQLAAGPGLVESACGSRTNVGTTPDLTAQGKKGKKEKKREGQNASNEQTDPPIDSCSSNNQQARKLLVETILRLLLLSQSVASMNSDLLFPNQYLKLPLTDSTAQWIINSQRDRKKLSMWLGEEQYPSFGGDQPDELVKQIRKQAECVPQLPRKGMRTQDSHNGNSDLRNWPNSTGRR
ncbi:hypothetical protein [Amycolatopsis pigmentata]|uniref:Uncharacterized protein n=1 Tax=Amycolatopsis pigmentata TaxID=450801 RepID=A0ABW5FTE0_9PSEU